jgi:hypothetical protein
VEPAEVRYRGYEFTGLSRQTTEVKIVKLFNEAAVKEHGSFEYSYHEPFGNEIPSGFSISARVLKGSGKVHVVPESDVHRIVSLKNKRNDPVERKVIMKISNLEPGDILQIEYHLNQPFSISTSGLFFYQDRYPVLFSNVYVTFPPKYDIKVFSFPEDRIGQPQVEQVSKTYGSGKTYFWSVRNCGSIPNEPFSAPFEDVSLLTGFVVKILNGPDYSSWINLGINYYDDYVDDGSLPGSFFDQFGISKKADNISFGMIDTLYSKIKSNFRLKGSNLVYPDKDIKDVIENRLGDATDLSLIMYKVLEKWEQKANMVFIRDKRQGVVETSFPSIMWFDRAGVMVNIGGYEKVYDFDESAPLNYQTPWFLNGIKLYVVNKSGGYFKEFKFPSSTEHNQIIESHQFSLIGNLELKDSVILTYKGSFADEVRKNFYSLDEEEMQLGLHSELTSCFSKIDNCVSSDIFENSQINISGCGISSSNIQQVDSFLIINPQELVISRLKNKLISSARKNHINFDSPFRYIIEFNIPIPEGYEVKSLPSKSVSSTPFSSVFSMTCEKKDAAITISATLRVPQNLIGVSYYPQLKELFESSVKAINREVVFKKI